MLKNLILLFALFALVSCSYKAAEFEAIDTVVTNTEHKYIEIDPIGTTTQSCFIFYPGGLVKPESYISVYQLLAQKGIKVIILKATSDLAIFNPQRAAKVKAEFPEIEHWIIGGHSLGGTVGVMAILDQPDEYEGLILMGSYPAGGDDLSAWKGAVLSVSAENDGLATSEDIEKSKELLPEAIVIDRLADVPLKAMPGKTIFYKIKGGNHAQFGDYGAQKKDGVASISTAEQHDEMIQLFEAFFNANGWLE